MAAPSGFCYARRAGGEVVVTHRGRPAATLRGAAAAEFLDEIERADRLGAQHIMARYTGDYRRGNERLASRHPRNRT